MTRVENFCATGSEAFRNACYAVASGAYDVAMAVGVEADRFQHLDVAPAAYKDETGAVLGEFNKDFSDPYLVMDEALREGAVAPFRCVRSDAHRRR